MCDVMVIIISKNSLFNILDKVDMILSVETSPNVIGTKKEVSVSCILVRSG